jgi:predicted ester cyclase
MKNNKDIIAAYAQALWHDRDLSVINQVFSPTAKIHSPFNHTMHGCKTMHDIAEKWLTAFPDLCVIFEEYIAEDNCVVSRWVASGTHLGGFFDTKPTYRTVEFSGVTIYRLENEQIIDYRALVDVHAILSQLKEYDSIEEALAPE